MTEVFRHAAAIVELGGDWLVRLKAAATASPLGRSRVCVHADDAAAVQEMIIALRDDVLFRPHRHLGKTESFHLVEGELDIVVFDDGGAPLRAVTLSSAGAGKSFYYRLNQPLYHAILPRTPLVVFHETTTGPFSKDGTEFAGWAPHDQQQLRDFLEHAIKAAPPPSAERP